MVGGHLEERDRGLEGQPQQVFPFRQRDQGRTLKGKELKQQTEETKIEIRRVSNEAAPKRQVKLADNRKAGLVNRQHQRKDEELSHLQ